jgi:hypothetical protein
MAFRERRRVRRLLLSDVDGSSVTSHMRDEARGWFHHSRSPDSHEDRAFVQSAKDAIQFEGHFAEPADVRPNPTAALTSGMLGWWIVSARVAKWRSAACVAAALEKLAVHVDDAFRFGLLM